MDLRARIGLLVQAQGTRRASEDIAGVAGSTKRLGSETEIAAGKMRLAERQALAFRRGLIGMTSYVTAGAIGIFGLGAVLHGAAEEYQKTWKATQATNAVLASTGGAANISAEGVARLSDHLSLQAGIDNELIQQGENLLLTFRNIRNEAGLGNDIFNQTTKAAVDMSAAFTAAGKSMDVSEAALQLGKALNDPAKGMARLMRVGVSFTAQQIAQAKQLQKNGDLLGAQKIILGELTQEFGDAARKTASPFDKARVAWHEAERDLATGLAPAATAVAIAFTQFTQQVRDNTGVGGQVRGVIVGIYNAVKTLWPVIVGIGGAWLTYRGILLAVAAAEHIVSAVQLVAYFVQAARAAGLMTAGMVALDAATEANPIIALATAVVAVGAALYLAYTKVKWFHNAINDTWAWIKGHWALLAGPFLLVIGPIVLLVKYFHSIVKAAKDAYNWVSNLVGALDDLNPFSSHHIQGQVVHLVHGQYVPSVPGMATGGTVTAPGASVVGEDGPELLELPTGATVTPLSPVAPVGASRAGGDSQVQLEIPVYLDGRKVGTGLRRVSLAALLGESPA